VARTLPNYRLSKFQPIMPPWVERETVARYLLDAGATWRWLSGSAQDDPPELPVDTLPPLHRDPHRPLVGVRTTAALEAAAVDILQETAVVLAVETTLAGRALCLIQIAGTERTWLIDPLEVADLEALRPILEHAVPTKLVHGAAPVREVWGRHGFALAGVVDTRDLSRTKRGEGIAHTLRRLEGTTSVV
jgi:ATP-dependent Lhr-like helicase